MDSLGDSINTTTVTLVSIATLLVALWVWCQQKPSRNFPPGPKGWPLIGDMLEFRSENANKVFRKLAQKYGDIFSFRVGQTWMVVFNSSEVIREALVKKGADFADRPTSYTLGILSEGGKNIGHGQYTSTWRLHRKLAHTAIRKFALGEDEKFESLLYRMIEKMDKVLEEKGDQPFEPKEVLCVAVYNYLATMCFGKTYEFDDPHFQEFMSITKATLEVKSGLPPDYFPILRFIPTKREKFLRNNMKRMLGVIGKEFKNHMENYDGGDPKDFMEFLLKTKQEMIDEGSEQMDLITDTHMKMTMVDIFFAGTSTTIYTLQWAIALMAKYPVIQAKVAKEIDDVTGGKRNVKLNDRQNLPYTEATLNEIYRYSSLANLAVPHATHEDVEIGGYFIPKGIICLFNLQAVHYDTDYWNEPEKFKPEHFLDEAGSVRVDPNYFMPYSIGRRVCVGQALATVKIFLLFTWLFQHYKFSKPPGVEDIDTDRLEPVPTGNMLMEFDIVATKIC